MKKKIFKIVTVILLLALLTMPNFIYVGTGLVSYAVDSITTNHQNVEFDAKLKEGNILELLINVKKEGYFNGEITLENSNFTFKQEQTNPNVNSIESNKVVLNQISSGSNVQIDLEVQPVTDEIFDAGLLNVSSKVNITGIYRDSTEKDINIRAAREVKLEYTEDNTNENVESTTKVITNKVIKISGEDKRVVQLEMNLGLKQNNYPIKEIEVNMDVPVIEGKAPTVVGKVDFNTMSNYNLNYENTTEKSRLQVLFSNKADEQNRVIWKKQGNEKVVVTLIYDKDVALENIEIPYEEKVTLYNEKELTDSSKLVIDNEEKEELVKITATSTESKIYKGKLNAGIDRQYETKTNIAVNLANVGQFVDVKETADNTIFNKTIISKESFKEIFGENGQIIILNENAEIIATINNQTQADESGNFVIDYTGKEPSILEIKTTTPVKEGNIELINTKTIKAENREIFKNKEELNTRITYEYVEGEIKEYTSAIKLEETVTEAIIDISKDNLSTLTTNNVEIRATLKSSEEKNDLYKNPKLQIILPEEIENIKVNGINKLYADELQITKANTGTVEGIGKIINIELEGEQTEFTSQISEGIQIIIDAEITFNKTTPTKQSRIDLKYTNENGKELNYETSKDIKITSKYGLFVYTRIDDGNEVIESTSNEEVKTNISSDEGKEIVIERNIINNYENNMENVVLTGEIPQFGMIKELKTNVEGSKIYYLDNQNNEWKENIEDVSTAKSYKIDLPNNQILPGQSVKITYKLGIAKEMEDNVKESENLNISLVNAGQNISENYVVSFVVTPVKYRDINLVKPLSEENLSGIGQMKVLAVSAGEELKEDQEINEGQTVKVKLQLTNTTNSELKNVRIVAKQQNAIFYDYTETQEINTLTHDNMNVTFYDEKEETTHRVFTADNINPGETAEFEYEYSVKEMPGEETKGTIEVSAENKETQTISTLKNNIVDADVKIKMLNAKNLEVGLYADYIYNSKISVKNISGRELKNIKVEIPLGEYFEDKIELFNNEGNLTFEKIENGIAILNINSLASGETVTDVITFYLKDFEEKEVDIKLSAVTTINDRTYISNEIDRKAYQVKAKISIVQEGSIEGNTVKTGDKIIYTTTIRNDDEDTQNISIHNEMQNELVMEKAYLVRNGKEEEIEINQNESSIEYDTVVSGKEEIKFIAEAEVYTQFDEEKEITNVVELYAPMQYLQSNPVTYIINSEQGETDPDNPSDPSNPGSEDPENPSKTTGTISGTVWLDENRNGKKDADEKNLDNIEVRLLNTADNQIQAKTMTETNGNYKFENINDGKYIIAVKYDTLKYSVTEYKRDGIDETENSDVITKEVNGEILAITDGLTVDGNIISNVDAGLIENKIFDLSLNKYINKVTIQNKEGTKVLQYNKEKLAKAEIHAKQINGSNVIVEYGIDIKNEGEIPGYASEIIDQLPNDFKFSSELNKEWYISTDNWLHTTSLSNEIINPGETKTLTLVLTKTMTENNTGTSLNTAEIVKTSNNLAIEDIDSKPANNNTGEDDRSEASIMISINTGIEIVIGIISILITMIIIATLIIIIKRGDKNE